MEKGQYSCDSGTPTGFASGTRRKCTGGGIIDIHGIDTNGTSADGISTNGTNIIDTNGSSTSTGGIRTKVSGCSTKCCTGQGERDGASADGQLRRHRCAVCNPRQWGDCAVGWINIGRQWE
ncbi:hypothetical protein GCM10010969_21610 [Saccharibacillus kuerlensis]|uniref:Uncharacterized protein n=1 Tax=Saccharibacillus kuerlensis TaxID=459527 RepID=A0ABQ2L2G9_9BACL|nr:hypothetical protein GCM10010969_21610 [Saccharibacillus kuerlensis]